MHEEGREGGYRETEVTVVALNLSDGMLINKKSLNFSRRAERKTVDLSFRLRSMRPVLFSYFVRLSFYLFLLPRTELRFLPLYVEMEMA